MEINYKRVCRTCLCQLGPGVDFYRLNSSMPTQDGTANKISLLECWQFCTKLIDQTELPIYICKECAEHLFTAYNIISNALQNYEVLRQKLGFVPKARKNGSQRSFHLRCKLCDITVHKKDMKEHVALHVDDLEYRCKLCSFKAKRRSILLTHYVEVHEKEPTPEELKPITIKKSEHSDNIVKKSFSDCFLAALEHDLTENMQTDELNDEEQAPIDNGNRIVILSDIALQTANTASMSFNNTNDKVVEKNVANNVLKNHMNDIYMQNNESIEQAPDAAEIEAAVVAIADSTKKSICCKICGISTDSQEDLKTHMLTHNEIPHFFCNQCEFYTFFKVDLAQHYKNKHDMHPTLLQLQPRNLINKRIYFKCNLCAHRTAYKENLRRHYAIKHNLLPTKVRLQMDTKALKTIAARVNNKNVIKQRKSKLQMSSTKDVISTTTSAGASEAEQDDIAAAVKIIDKHRKFELDLNGDAIFDDMMESLKHKNANCSTLLSTNVLLTSDEEDAAISVNHAEIQCSVCDKTFISHYKFENHMFLHRGLAPYQCELCTNLYNTKWALLHHYLAVHKQEPTRNMLQAKGDKSQNAASTKEIVMQHESTVTLMCGNCPFESKDRNELLQHLHTVHKTTNERLIISKLLVECPYCIRSFPTYEWLMQHLQQSHLLVTTNSNDVVA